MKKTMASLILLSVVLSADPAKDSEGMYHSNTGNGPSVAEAVSNTTGGTAYTGLPGNTTSSVSKDSEALYQHNSGKYTKTITATFVPQPPDIIKTTWKTIYKDRIVYRYKDCGTGGGTTPPPPPVVKKVWSTTSIRTIFSGKTWVTNGGDALSKGWKVKSYGANRQTSTVVGPCGGSATRTVQLGSRNETICGVNVNFEAVGGRGARGTIVTINGGSF